MTDPLIHALAIRRNHLRLTQRRLAEVAEVSHSQVCAIEAGTHVPTLRTLRLLATALDCDLVLVPKEER